MQIYVGKNGQQLGPFSLEQVNRKLADGTFTGTDLGWYEGAAGWAPLSGIPGVVIQSTTAPAPAPAAIPTPAPAVAPAAPVTAAVRPNAPIVQPPKGNTKVLAVISWVLLGATLLFAFIPFVGCGVYLFVWPPALAVIIMAIIIMARGRTAQGVSLLLATVVVVCAALVVPVFTTAITVALLERKQLNQIAENLRTIDGAKTKWVAETKAANGAPVTMANLTSSLGGKEVKAVVDETYDPMPVGQPPTAALPMTKSLGPFGGGDLLTAVMIEQQLATYSVFTPSWRRTSGVSPNTPTPSPRQSPGPSLAPSAAPSVTASPYPSVSPRPSTSPPPRSLISPRQSIEPQQTPPSTRPSPSAKFAPRTAPRQSPSEDDSSGGLKQGRQYPRESPGETPDKQSDEDDDDSDE